ncbi:hypothetical protein JKP88DRAFT_248146 [Tribonema minus]|uniref:Uncharacterized protein n=1 Tax=Tribonema minus TaxID=303371 RepID=A0A836CA59_9STRA|nr:hypothetical protein JKP88DRAFT_248146 [Tribonema minus]
MSSPVRRSKCDTRAPLWHSRYEIDGATRYQPLEDEDLSANDHHEAQDEAQDDPYVDDVDDEDIEEDEIDELVQPLTFRKRPRIGDSSTAGGYGRSHASSTWPSYIDSTSAVAAAAAALPPALNGGGSSSGGAALLTPHPPVAAAATMAAAPLLAHSGDGGGYGSAAAPAIHISSAAAVAMQCVDLDSSNSAAAPSHAHNAATPARHARKTPSAARAAPFAKANTTRHDLATWATDPSLCEEEVFRMLQVADPVLRNHERALELARMGGELLGKRFEQLLPGSDEPWRGTAPQSWEALTFTAQVNIWRSVYLSFFKTGDQHICELSDWQEVCSTAQSLISEHDPLRALSHLRTNFFNGGPATLHFSPALEQLLRSESPALPPRERVVVVVAHCRARGKLEFCAPGCDAATGVNWRAVQPLVGKYWVAYQANFGSTCLHQPRIGGACGACCASRRQYRRDLLECRDRVEQLVLASVGGIFGASRICMWQFAECEEGKGEGGGAAAAVARRAKLEEAQVIVTMHLCMCGTAAALYELARKLLRLRGREEPTEEPTEGGRCGPDLEPTEGEVVMAAILAVQRRVEEAAKLRGNTQGAQASVAVAAAAVEKVRGEATRARLLAVAQESKLNTRGFTTSSAYTERCLLVHVTRLGGGGGGSSNGGGGAHAHGHLLAVSAAHNAIMHACPSMIQHEVQAHTCIRHRVAVMTYVGVESQQQRHLVRAACGDLDIDPLDLAQRHHDAPDAPDVEELIALINQRVDGCDVRAALRGIHGGLASRMARCTNLSVEDLEQQLKGVCGVLDLLAEDGLGGSTEYICLHEEAARLDVLRQEVADERQSAVRGGEASMARHGCTCSEGEDCPVQLALAQSGVTLSQAEEMHAAHRGSCRGTGSCVAAREMGVESTKPGLDPKTGLVLAGAGTKENGDRKTSCKERVDTVYVVTGPDGRDRPAMVQEKKAGEARRLTEGGAALKVDIVYVVTGPDGRDSFATVQEKKAGVARRLTEGGAVLKGLAAANKCVSKGCDCTSAGSDCKCRALGHQHHKQAAANAGGLNCVKCPAEVKQWAKGIRVEVVDGAEQGPSLAKMGVTQLADLLVNIEGKHTNRPLSKGFALEVIHRKWAAGTQMYKYAQGDRHLGVPPRGIPIKLESFKAECAPQTWRPRQGFERYNASQVAHQQCCRS